MPPHRALSSNIAILILSKVKTSKLFGSRGTNNKDHQTMVNSLLDSDQTRFCVPADLGVCICLFVSVPPYLFRTKAFMLAAIRSEYSAMTNQSQSCDQSIALL